VDQSQCQAGPSWLNAKLVELAKTADMMAKMRAINVIVPPQTPEEIRAYMIWDTKRSAELIKTPTSSSSRRAPSPVDVGHEEGAVGSGGARWRDRKARLLGGKHHVLVHDGVPAAAHKSCLEQVAGLR
jgi:hypothetical protein